MVRGLMFRIAAALAVALTAGAVLVATGSAATANDGDPVIQGAFNSGQATTTIYSSNGNGLEAYGVTGVFGGGTGPNSYGVRGSATSTGAFAGTGVYGYTGSTNGGNGVWGQTSSSGRRGVPPAASACSPKAPARHCRSADARCSRPLGLP